MVAGIRRADAGPLSMLLANWADRAGVLGILRIEVQNAS